MSEQLGLALERPAVEAAIAMGITGQQRAAEHAEREAPGFAEEAYRFLCGYAKTHFSRPFASEDVVEVAAVCGLVPPDGRAWGGIFLRAARAGVIRRSKTLVRRTKGHGSLVPAWEAV